MEQQYMLDSNVIIDLSKDADRLMRFVMARGMGVRFYITPVQENEIAFQSYKKPGRVPSAINTTEKQAKVASVQKVCEKLNIILVSSIAFWNKGIRVDGVERFISEDNRNPFINDAFTPKGKSPDLGDRLISEAATYHQMTLISDDIDTRKMINRRVPGKAISSDDFIAQVMQMQGNNA